MPYIGKEARVELDKWVDDFPRVTDYGEMNYAITKLLLNTYPQNYREYQALIGLLESCKLEFYRRAMAPYEVDKMLANGDVY